MPPLLSTLQEDTDLLSIRQAPGLKFLIFYSSIVDGQLWCPDCRHVEQLVNDTLLSSDLDAVIVYVGDQPWKVSSVPTIIRLRDGKEEGRLVDQDIKGGLADFIHG
ncbi:hypothetical protein K443DRAFT_87470 [Laccaria amethystina LaAM-08-1]|uniref:Thioredoxin domain-containing protein n=1 Tax=Laccaria amethystina LaAM-08-1 TaxID=1095629 RepID=A0A0C9XZV8_9AGAR|nr:hypothetical protein K443DRAFT_87470 [Laccaria amethystina LaAM-08-1]